MSTTPAPLLNSTPQASLSVIVPVYNETGNIPALCERLSVVLASLQRPYEVIVVNDGSADDSLQVLLAAARKYPYIRVLDLSRNYGQTAALMAGFDHARHDIIVALDADLQNFPEDIPLLLEKLDEGFDVVSGWRRDRKDAKVRRNFLSRVANRLITSISGVALHDFGCTLKAYRRSMMQHVRLYGEMHRFIPIYAHWQGARVAEIPVRHAPRHSGKSQYGMERIFKVMLDLMVIKFIHRFLTKPIYVFGGAGLSLLAVSMAAGVTALGLKLFAGVSLILTPLPLLAAMTFITGFMCLLMGFLAEISMRTYFESQKKSVYLVRREYTS